MKAVVPSPVRREAGFTMVELALCIAIISIAMVAIMGILPAGMGVQKQNREDSIISQEASHWMESIRNGSLLFDDATNYVDFVQVGQQRINSPVIQTNIFPGIYLNTPAANAIPSTMRLSYPELILGLLSLPKYDSFPNDQAAKPVTVTNTVFAVVRALTGSLNEKVLPQVLNEKPVESQLSFAFRYLLRAEIVPVAELPIDRSNAGLRQWNARQRSLYDVRLTFEWPVIGTDFAIRTGGNSRTFRAQVSAQDRYQRDTKGNILVAPNSPINLRQMIPASSRLPVL
jgi:prepilin-type N-terminal cleavage/methylation domain-containing protein